MVKRAISLAWLAAFFVGGCSTYTPTGLTRSQLSDLQASVVIPDPVSWQGGGCKIDFGNPSRRKGALWLAASEGTSRSCSTGRLKLPAGHFDISFKLKARGLELGNSRKFSEAFRTRIRIFDKTGKQISLKRKHFNRAFNASEPGAGLNSISDNDLFESRDYALVRPITRSYAWDYGWIPEGAAEAEITFELIGPGKVWIDDLKMQPTKWNLSLKERVEPYWDTEDIFPAPQQIKFTGQSFEFSSQSDRLLCIRASSFSAGVVTTLEIVRENLVKRSGSELIRNSECRPEDIYIDLIEADFEDRERYHLYQPVPGTARLVIEAAGARGFSYGLYTLSQLVKLDQDVAYLLIADIVDFPWFKKRTVGGKGTKQWGYFPEYAAMSWLAESRVNGLLIEHYNHNLAWWEKDELLLQSAKVLNYNSNTTGLVDIGYLLNPYVHTNDKKLGDDLELSDPETISKIVKAARVYTDRGAKYLVLRTDDFVPKINKNAFGWGLKNHRDKEVFGTLGSAHLFLIERLSGELRKTGWKGEFLFVPPWYTNRFVQKSGGLGESYFKDLATRVDSDIPFGWTGPTVRSLSIDDLHLDYFRKIAGERKLFLWDNTIYARRHRHYWGNHSKRAQLGSYIEPYSVQFPELPGFDREELMFLNSNITPLGRIQIATYGSFLWNPKAYHPERTLISFLKWRYGEKLAHLLVNFDSELWELTRKRADAHTSDIRRKERLGVARALDINRLKRALELIKSKLATNQMALYRELQKRLFSEIKKNQLMW